MSIFSGASMAISVLSTIQVLAWIGTLWLGRPVMAPALRFVLGFIAIFVIGGLGAYHIAQHPAVTCAQLRAGGARRRLRRLR